MIKIFVVEKIRSERPYRLTETVSFEDGALVERTDCSFSTRESARDLAFRLSEDGDWIADMTGEGGPQAGTYYCGVGSGLSPLENNCGSTIVSHVIEMRNLRKNGF